MSLEPMLGITIPCYFYQGSQGRTRLEEQKVVVCQTPFSVADILTHFIFPQSHTLTIDCPTSDVSTYDFSTL